MPKRFDVQLKWVGGEEERCACEFVWDGGQEVGLKIFPFCFYRNI